MTITQGVLLFVAATMGAALNAVAGGGSLFSFPALLFVGVPSITANATNKVALWPGMVASVGAYRRELVTQKRTTLLYLGIASFVGGLLGALLLLITPESVFDQLVPYLLLIATLLFTFSKTINNQVQRFSKASQRRSRGQFIGALLLQLAVATYGGFFGAGLGIMLLGALAVMGMEEMHVMNALKTLLTSIIGGIAVVTFVVSGIVAWPQAIIMLIGSITGGYGGATVARKLDPKLVRGFVILAGFTITIIFFVQQYTG